MSDIITHASTFSGIGASELAAEMLGWKNLFHCEINEFGRKVLEYHFPDTKSYEDIKSTDFTEWRGKVTVLTGGFPCQPFSCAGKRRGPKDDRYLWPHMLNCIKQVRPTWFIGENVVGITTMAFQGENVKVGEQADLFGEGDGYEIYEKREKYVLGKIYRSLESVGYSVQTFIIPACAVGAPHRRDRVFIVAHRLAETSDSVRCGGSVREKNPTPGNSGSLGQEVLSAYIQKRMPSLLPTPLASEGDKYANKYNSRSQMGRSLSAMGGSGLLPTPRANEVTDINLNSPNLANRNHSNLEEEVAKHVCSLKIDGETFRLSPLFVEEMMGFPLGWTALPFLSQDGEKKP